MVDETTLLRVPRGSVVAPAGCGKTELIARAVRKPEGAGALILTHTHAGVYAIRSRLKRLGVERRRANVETIAGWCLRFAAAYPNSSALPTREPVKGEWNAVYGCALRILKTRAIRSVVRASYSRVLVDEYQDCIPSQHEVIIELAKILPTCVFGDPLQGIFGFAGGNLSWSEDVEGEFDPIGMLTRPWRWEGKNEDLGKWLLDLRETLINGNEIDLAEGPITWMASTPENQRKAAFLLAKNREQHVVAIRKWPKDAHAFARGVGGVFLSMEPIECDDLSRFAEDMDRYCGSVRAFRFVKFAAECFTEVGSLLASVQEQLCKGVVPDAKRYPKIGPVVASLAVIAADSDPMDILSAMARIESVPNVKLFRRELWNEAKRGVSELYIGNYLTLKESVWAVRNRQRMTGRAMDPRTVSRTLLIKGLEFDNALILNADEFEDKKLGEGAKNFYVAATRAARSLVVLSASDKVRFSSPCF